MMEIDATVFIQMGHFVIVWMLLDRLLLRKLVTLIQQEEATYDYLVQEVTTSKKAIIAEQERQKEQWHMYKVLISTKVPAANKSFSSSPFDMHMCPVSLGVDETTRQELVKEVNDHMVRKLLHD